MSVRERSPVRTDKPLTTFFIPEENAEVGYYATRFRLKNDEEEEKKVTCSMEVLFHGHTEKQFVSKILPGHGTSWQTIERAIRSQDYICAFRVRVNDGREPIKQTLIECINLFPECEVVAYIDWGYVNAVVCSDEYECEPRQVKETLTKNFPSSSAQIDVHRKTKALSKDLPHILTRHFYNRHFLFVNSPSGVFSRLFGSMYAGASGTTP